MFLFPIHEDIRPMRSSLKVYRPSESITRGESTLRRYVTESACAVVVVAGGLLINHIGARAAHIITPCLPAKPAVLTIPLSSPLLTLFQALKGCSFMAFLTGLKALTRASLRGGGWLCGLHRNTPLVGFNTDLPSSIVYQTLYRYS